MPNYPEKYLFKIKILVRDGVKEPENPSEALKLLIKHDYMNSVTHLAVYIKEGLDINDIPKMPEEAYPEFIAYKIKDNYLESVRKYMLVIRQKIVKYNAEKVKNKRKELGQGISIAVKGLEELINSI